MVYLGHVIDEDGVKPQTSKVEDIQKIPLSIIFRNVMISLYLAWQPNVHVSVISCTRTGYGVRIRNTQRQLRQSKSPHINGHLDPL